MGNLCRKSNENILGMMIGDTSRNGNWLEIESAVKSIAQAYNNQYGTRIQCVPKVT
jgi:hypothetical protein